MSKQLTLSATFARSYKKNGNDVFVYTLSGTKEAEARYKEIQGDFLRTDEGTGKDLYFSTRFNGNKCTMIITEKGNVVPDMSEFNKAASLAKQYGGNLGQELAKQAAATLMGGGANNDVPTTTDPVSTQADPSLIEKQ